MNHTLKRVLAFLVLVITFFAWYVSIFGMGSFSSAKDALKYGLEPLVFMHYPPIYGNGYNYDILDVLYKFNIKSCWYGHLHGSAIRNSINGERDGIDFKLISGDCLQFCPLKIM